MSKKVKIILAVLLAVVVLTVGVVSVAMAQTPTPTPQAEGKGLLARVAAILGGNVTEQRLIDAFKQANIANQEQGH